MTVDKVYCSDCKYYRQPYFGRFTIPARCNHPKTQIDTPIFRDGESGDPYKVNKNNDCEYFEQKELVKAKKPWWNIFGK